MDKQVTARPGSAAAVLKLRSPYAVKSPEVSSASPSLEVRRRKRATSAVPSHFVAADEGSLKLRAVLGRMIEALGLEGRATELQQAARRMHRDQKHLSGRNGCPSKNAATQQAAAVLTVALRGQKVRHPEGATFERVGSSVPMVPIELAARLLVAQA